jgi:protocatechuate 3,4-dioxygenase alpha subunit
MAEDLPRGQSRPRLNLERLTDEASNLYGNLGPTPSQTVGPYFHQGLIEEFQALGAAAGAVMVEAKSSVPGERLLLTGKIYDAEGEAVPDALLEIWQPGADGTFVTVPGAGFSGFGRAHTRTDDASYALHTIRPGRVNGLPPRLMLWLGLRGLLTHLITFIYFGDEDNSGDPVLNAVPEARRDTLMARRTDGPAGPVYTFDIYLQGEHETAFFDAY